MLDQSIQNAGGLHNQQMRIDMLFKYSYARTLMQPMPATAHGVFVYAATCSTMLVLPPRV